MYYLSKYNHLFETRTATGKPVRLLSNLFLGASTQVNENIYTVFQAGEKTRTIDENVLSADILHYFIDRGYLWTEATSEEVMIETAFKQSFNRDGMSENLQSSHYGFITSMNCNLDCPYCFQRNKSDSGSTLTSKQVDLAFNVIANHQEKVQDFIKNKRFPKITITGGEPLLRNKANLQVLEYLLERLGALQWKYNIITNGTELTQFVETRSLDENCRHIQVTLDGSAEIHDRRRCFRNGTPSFKKICSGIDAALSANWPIVLRVNLDINNVNYMSELAKFIQTQGWCNHPNFHAYLSPVTNHNNLDDYPENNEASLLVELLCLIRGNPEIRDVFDIRHFLGFSYVEDMVNKKPRFPNYYRCEDVRKMYIFDSKGDIYSCLEAVGNPLFRIGTYDPNFELNHSSIAQWTERNVMTLDNCRNCKICFICAGGCAFEGFNYPEKIHCMPFLEEIDIAWEHYVKTKPELFTGSAS